MFTLNSQIESWLIKPYSPSGHTDIELIVGGKFELFWNPENLENNSTIGCRITALSDDEFLSFEWKGPEVFKGFMNNADPLTHVTVFFTPKNDGLTRVNLIHSGWRSPPQWEEARKWFEKSWSSAFDHLTRIVNGS